MVSTITTSTVSTMSTAALAGSVVLVGIILLLVLLLHREFLSSSVGTRYRTLNKALNLAISPLLIAFILVVISRIVKILH